jgi:ribosomal protection tetracycline resistance protein
LQEAGTTVCEPVHRFQLEIPSDTFGAVSRELARLEGSLSTIATRVTSSQLEGDIAAARVHELQQRMPGFTRGEGVLTSAFDHY